MMRSAWIVDQVRAAVASLTLPLGRSRSQRGQGMVEYGLILVLVAVAVIGLLLALSGQLGTVFNNIQNGLAGGQPGLTGPGWPSPAAPAGRRRAALTPPAPSPGASGATRRPPAPRR
jgi:pilus assembly protein Flp/PilA